jgi:Skp family chaperone for outer membrane proteins
MGEGRSQSDSGRESFMKKVDLMSGMTVVLFFISLLAAVPAGQAVAAEGEKGRASQEKPYDLKSLKKQQKDEIKEMKRRHKEEQKELKAQQKDELKELKARHKEGQEAYQKESDRRSKEREEVEKESEEERGRGKKEKRERGGGRY